MFTRGSAPPSASCTFETSDVSIGEDRHIHHVRYFRSAEGQCQKEYGMPLVCLHGWAAGAAIFATSAPALRAVWDGPLFSLDWFGCGLSSRPKWAPGIGHEADINATEEFFVEPLEAWRKAMGFERMVLLGHSMGGHLVVCYSLRYPDRVERLILASSAGLTQRPEGLEERLAAAPIGQRLGVRLLTGLWSVGLHPMMVIWLSARMPFRRFMLWRFFNMFRPASWLPRELLVEYHYQSWTCDRISGGHWVNAANGPDGFLRRDIRDHIGKLRVPRVSLIFGTDDPNLRNATTAKRFLQQAGVLVDVLLVEDGGHTMHVSNPIGFAEAVDATRTRNTDGATFGHEPLRKEFPHSAL
eukprot:gnl/TRDRNA2_/TRDRNA2_201685_c0_seq1.p1 gnl/TRDRNA2_/TRDRNA2_201685_c0~~gnl/TRDRNA2_/TRDRNA2_201685_c0_seq1.p1  ORF type:complete len:378 (+),score=49.27 gnl/TRDRNA2_/TRDRNA2_201685_c0_seq1:72-1136(+)